MIPIHPRVRSKLKTVLQTINVCMCHCEQLLAVGRRDRAASVLFQHADRKCASNTQDTAAKLTAESFLQMLSVQLQSRRKYHLSQSSRQPLSHFLHSPRAPLVHLVRRVSTNDALLLLKRMCAKNV